MDAPTIDIDAATSMDIDAPTLSIDGPGGNITSRNVTLHSHTHNVEDADPVGDNTAGADVESDPPTGAS